jgi:hypothetical protein
MENKYFGILTKEMYNNFSEDELHNFLNDNNLIQGVASLKFAEKRDTNEVNGVEIVFRGCISDRTYTYSNSLINKLYLFLKGYMIGAIETNLMMFNRDFEIKTYGYSNKKKKKIALKEFNRLFYELCEKNEIGFDINSNNDIGAAKRLPTLMQTQKHLIGVLKDENDLSANYIFGDINYFTRELFDKTPYLQLVFEFENKLSILVDLNKKFQFEEDDVFIKKPKSELIFEDYQNEFDSLKQIQFIEHQIVSKEKINRAFIVSLFDFLTNKLKIKTPAAESFGKIINSYFGFTFGEVKLNGSEGDLHSKRIEKIKKEWEDFTN